MFTEETVFILGAGASWHYGYPTGEGLIQKIKEKADYFIKQLNLKTPISIYGLEEYSVQDPQLPRLEHSPNRHKFIENCEQLRLRIKQTNTMVIDNFLTRQPPAIKEMGKLLIAWVILDCESKVLEGQIGNIDNNYNINRLNDYHYVFKNKNTQGQLMEYKDDWVRFVFAKLSDDCDELAKNKVKFITFNYDLSLETQLKRGFTGIREHFPEIDVDNFLSDRITHIYGRIRNNVDRLKDKFFYQLPFDEQMHEAYEASKLIHTINEHEKNGATENEEIKNAKCAAKLALKTARKIYILGFGFDQRNCDGINLLQLGDRVAQGTREIFISNYGDRNIVNKAATKNLINSSFPGNFIESMLIKPAIGFNHYEKSIKDVYHALADDFEV